jgi:hypothetical protein
VINADVPRSDGGSAKLCSPCQAAGVSRVATRLVMNVDSRRQKLMGIHAGMSKKGCIPMCTAHASGAWRPPASIAPITVANQVGLELDNKTCLKDGDLAAETLEGF